MAVINITSNNFANLVLKSQKPALVLFWAVGSPRNATWDRLMHELDEEGDEDLTLCKVSVNYAPHIAVRFHIAVYPTVALFRGKEVLGAFSGQPSMKTLRELIALADEPVRNAGGQEAAATEQPAPAESSGRPGQSGTAEPA